MGDPKYAFGSPWTPLPSWWVAPRFGIRPKGPFPADVATVTVSDRLILSERTVVCESRVGTKRRFERSEAMATTKTTWARMAHLQVMQKARVSRPGITKVVVRSHKADGDRMRRDEPVVAPALGMVLAVTIAWNTTQDAMAIGITDQESYLSSLGSVSVESIQSQDKKKKVAKPEKPKPETKAKAVVADEPATTKKGKVSYAKPEAKVEVAVPATQKESKKETKVQTKPKPASAPTKAKVEAPTKAKAEVAPKAKVEVPSVTAPALPSLEIPKSSSSKATKALAIAGAEILAALAAAAAIKGLLA